MQLTQFCNLTADVDDYEGPPNGVDDFFELRLNRELTDAEASELKQHSPRFEKEAHSDYQVRCFTDL